MIFIDGNHDGDGPINDAISCAEYVAEDGMVFFHDLVFPAVARGLNYFREIGWNTRIYHTQQIMGVAWRGAIDPPEHIPDPRFEWDIPPHLNMYDGSGFLI
eukprot:TRINITY_DN3179_c0_g1_i4.p2 TRINITY_DN3179_c0_g1~~TRINITY_DN3179_c0_g1_i4.p2  ORF type:complete len:101 (-),score=19.83 TRINITY_DN3179_c0_g1_i4:51-353(-)